MQCKPDILNHHAKRLDLECALLKLPGRLFNLPTVKEGYTILSAMASY